MLVLVNNKIDSICCTDPDATVNLITRVNNAFVNQVEKLLELIPRAGNLSSLKRTASLLEKRLYCCAEDELEFSILNPPTADYEATIEIRKVFKLDTSETVNNANSNTATATYHIGSRDVKIILTRDTTPQDAVLINEYIDAVWVDKTSEWTHVSTGIYTKTFRTYILPDIQLIVEVL